MASPVAGLTTIPPSPNRGAVRCSPKGAGVPWDPVQLMREGLVLPEGEIQPQGCPGGPGHAPLGLVPRVCLSWLEVLGSPRSFTSPVTAVGTPTSFCWGSQEPTPATLASPGPGPSRHLLQQRGLGRAGRTGPTVETPNYHPLWASGELGLPPEILPEGPPPSLQPPRVHGNCPHPRSKGSLALGRRC